MNNPERAPRALTDGPGPACSLPVRIYYHHTDAGGVVYHGRYLDFMEAARIELLNGLGLDLAELAARDHALFMVYRLEVDYHKPARLNDLLTVGASIARVGRVRLDFDQQVRRGDELLVAGKVLAACVDPRTFRPTALPERLRLQLQHR